MYFKMKTDIKWQKVKLKPLQNHGGHIGKLDTMKAEMNH